MDALKGHVDEFAVVAIRATYWLVLNVLAMFMPSCCLNALLAVLIIRHLRSFSSSFTASTYRMHQTLVACLLCQVGNYLSFQFYVLIKIRSQTFTPIFLLAGPVTAATYFFIAEGWRSKTNLQFVASLFIFMISCHPLVDHSFLIHYFLGKCPVHLIFC